MNDGREYRYQKDWSIDGQMFHVRCDEWDIFLKAIENMETIIPTNEIKPVVSQPMASQPVQQQHPTTCKKCGAIMVNNPKTGKWFCKDKCWLQQ